MPDKLLICTDLDRTLISNGSQPVCQHAMPLFRKLVSRPEIKLAYVTGRDKKLVLDAIRQFDLPVPDYAVTDVGSAIYKIQAGCWLRLIDWDQRICCDWKGKSRKDLAAFLSDLTQCQLQEEDKTGDSKHLYVARGGYLNMNGNYAAGILEGINHYFPELKLVD